MKRSLLILILFLTACVQKPTKTKSQQHIDSTYMALSTKTGVPISLIKILESETGGKAGHLKTNASAIVNFNDSSLVFQEPPTGKMVLLPGVWSNIGSKKNFYAVLQRIRPKVEPSGFKVFICNGYNGNDSDKIAILRSDDEFTPLVYMQTNGINMGYENAELITRLKVLGERLDLKLLGADFDWCEFSIGKDPGDWNELADEIYKLCPDVVDQGTYSVEELAKEMRKSKRLYLWFD